MELFLNLCWLSLLMPAWLLWRQRAMFARSGDRARKVTASRPARPLIFLCALGCALVLLFPVISASDDLHAMRAEMEESSPGKRSVSHAGSERASVGHSRWQNLPAMAVITLAFQLIGDMHEVFVVAMSPMAEPSLSRASRGPPISRLA